MDIAHYLQRKTKPVEKPFAPLKVDRALVEEGLQQFRKLGCAECHKKDEGRKPAYPRLTGKLRCRAPGAPRRKESSSKLSTERYLVAYGDPERGWRYAGPSKIEALRAAPQVRPALERRSEREGPDAAGVPRPIERKRVVQPEDREQDIHSDPNAVAG